MNNEQQHQTDAVAQNGTVKPTHDYQFNSTMIKIPSIEIFETGKGFTSFYDNTQMKSPISKTSSQHRQSLQIRHISFSHDVNTPVSSTLYSNKNNLSQLRSRVFSRRKTEYDDYIASSVKYNRLLELNNNRSKILTSLNKNKVGEIKVTLIQQRRPQDIMYQLQQRKINVEGWKPQSREGQVCIVNKDTIILLGGHNNNPLDTICTYKIRQNQWTKAKSTDSDLKRTYHTGVVYKSNYVIVFGGMSSYNPYYKTRECLNTCCLVSLVSYPLHLKRIKIANEQMMEPRRNHSALIIGKYMLVFGGINTKKDYLNDLKTLDLKELKWESRQYKIESTVLAEFMKNGLAKHCAFTYFKDRDSYPIYSKTYEDIEGVYIFGGNNQLGHENQMLCFSLKWRTPRLSRVDSSGYPPSSVQPIVAQYNKTTYIIVSGERHERQLHLFRVKDNEFVTVRSSLSNLGGIGSSLIQYRDSYYLLFGLGEQGYVGTITQLDVLERYRQKQSRKRGILDILRPGFFKRYQEDDSDGNTPPPS